MDKRDKRDQQTKLTLRLRPLAADFVHETAVALLKLPKHARILDIPCGTGALAERLLALEFNDIVCGDINLDNVEIGERVETVQVDLNQRTPFQDEEFDVVFCIECIEHLENPFHLVREFSRIISLEERLFFPLPMSCQRMPAPNF